CRSKAGAEKCRMRAILAVAALEVVAGGWVTRRKDRKPTMGEGPCGGPASGEKVKVAMYVMSICPFGVQAEDCFHPVLAEPGNWVDYQVDFIANEQNGTFTALHGEPEVKGTIVQLCAMKHHPEAAKWSAFIGCMNK